MAMTQDQFVALKRKITTERDTVTQNKGRLQQLKETAKSTYKVDSISELQELKSKKETELDMQLVKKKKQMEKLESILPQDVKDELYE